MAILLPQSTAYTFRLGPFLDSTDGNTQENALTVAYTDVLLSKAGGALTAKAETTNLTGTGANAHYTCILGTGDTGTLGSLRVWCHVTGALCVYQDFLIVPALVYNSLVAGSDNLQVDAIQVAGTAQTAGNLAAMITTVDDFVDTEITAIKTKTDFLPSVTAGAAGGLMIAGSNAATTFATLTVTGASVFTGNVSYAAGITITQSDLNSDGVSITGNGSGSGLRVQKGASGYDIQGDIQGNLSGSAGSVINLNTSYIDTTISSRATPTQVNTEVDTALADTNLNHIAGTATGIPAIPAGTYIDQMMDDGTAVYDRTTDSLQAIKDAIPSVPT